MQGLTPFRGHRRETIALELAPLSRRQQEQRLSLKVVLSGPLYDCPVEFLVERIVIQFSLWLCRSRVYLCRQ